MWWGLCLVAVVAVACTQYCAQPASVRAVASDARSTGATATLPILMYHSICKKNVGKYIVSPTQFENDLVMLKKHGFTAVFMSEVINWVDGRGKLPARPIVITMDDGYYNNLYYGLEIAKRHNVKFMINPVTGFSQFTIDKKDANNPNYSHLTFEQMRECVESGLVEIGNHTHNLHSFKPRFGVMNLQGETDEHYRHAIEPDIRHAQELLARGGVPAPTTFAYPFGKYSKKSRELLLNMGFRALLTCNELVNTIRQGDPTCLHSLGRFNRSGNYTTSYFVEKFR